MVLWAMHTSEAIRHSMIISIYADLLRSPPWHTNTQTRLTNWRERLTSRSDVVQVMDGGDLIIDPEALPNTNDARLVRRLQVVVLFSSCWVQFAGSLVSELEYTAYSTQEYINYNAHD